MPLRTGLRRYTTSAPNWNVSAGSVGPAALGGDTAGGQGGVDEAGAGGVGGGGSGLPRAVRLEGLLLSASADGSGELRALPRAVRVLPLAGGEGGADSAVRRWRGGPLSPGWCSVMCLESTRSMSPSSNSTTNAASSPPVQGQVAATLPTYQRPLTLHRARTRFPGMKSLPSWAAAPPAVALVDCTVGSWALLRASRGPARREGECMLLLLLALVPALLATPSAVATSVAPTLDREGATLSDTPAMPRTSSGDRTGAAAAADCFLRPDDERGFPAAFLGRADPLPPGCLFREGVRLASSSWFWVFWGVLLLGVGVWGVGGGV